MQKATGTILIAFLAGIVVAEGTAYFLSGRHQKAIQPVQVASVQAPAVRQSATDTVPDQTAEPQQRETVVTEPEKPAAARPETTSTPKRKRSPAVEHRARETHVATDTEAAAAPQPTEAEVAQNSAPAGGQSAAQNQAGLNQQNSAQQSNASEQTAALNPPPDTQTAPPAPRTPQTVTIAAGTLLPVRVNETISTETNYSGDAFTATLEKPLVVNGFVIADRGARVTGTVVQAEKAGRVKGVADIQLALTKLHTTDGQTVNIVTVPWDKRGAGSKKRDTAEMAGGAALGAIIGAIAGGGRGAAIGAGAGGAAGTGVVLSQRGKSATIPSETRLTFTLDSPVTITEQL